MRTFVRKANRTIGFSARPDKLSQGRCDLLYLDRLGRLRNPLRDGLELGQEFLAHLVRVVRVLCAERLMAPTAWPVRSRTGTAIERSPRSSSSSTMENPCSRSARTRSNSACMSVIV